jgi:hypothetical protein
MTTNSFNVVSSMGGDFAFSPVSDMLRKSKIIEDMYNSGGHYAPEFERFLLSLETDQITQYMNSELDPSTLSDESLELYKSAVQKQLINEQRAKQDNIDYESGVANKLFRFNLARMDTPIEKAGYLEQTIGQEGVDWGVDGGGRYFLTESGLSRLNGRQTFLPEGIIGRAIDESSFFTGADFAEFGAYAPQIIGGIGMGMRFSGFGFVPGVIASGVGEVGGYLVDELAEYLQGYQDQPLFPQHEGNQSVLGSSAWNFAYGAGGESFVRFLRPIGRMITDPQAGLIAFRGNAPINEKQAKALIEGNQDEILSAFPDLETNLKGTYKNLSKEEYDALVKTAVEQMRVKFLGGAIYKQPGNVDLYNPYSNVQSKVDPAKQRAASQILEGDPALGVPGGTPSIIQATPRRILGYIQGTLERVFGNSRDKLNRQFLEKSMLSLRAKAAGFKPDEIFDLIKRNQLPSTDKNFLSDAAFGKLISERLGGQKLSFTAAIQTSNKEINDALNSTLKNLETLSLTNKEGFDSIASKLTSAKTSYNVNYASLLNNIDKRVGDGLFDLSALKSAADDIRKILPTKEIDQVQQKFTPEGLPFGSETIKKTVIDDALVPKEILNFLDSIKNAKATTTGLNVNAYESIINTLIENPSIAKNIPFERLVAMQNSLDHVYSSGIAKAGNLAQTTEGGKAVLNDLMSILSQRDKVGKQLAKVNSKLMINIAKSGENLDMLGAETIFANMIKTGDTKSLNQILSLLPDAQARTVKSDLGKLSLNNAINASKDVSGAIDIGKFVNNWTTLNKQVKGNMADLYGDNLQTINNLVTRLNKLSGTLDQKTLEELTEAIARQEGGQNFSGAINILTKNVIAKENLDNFMSQNWRRVLSDPDNVQFEQAIDAIFKPKSSKLATEVLEHFKDDPRIIEAIKAKSMEKILRSAVDASDNFNIIYSGANLNKALDRYGASTLQSMFGKDLTSDLYDFARQLNLISLGKNQGAGGIVAANLTLSPIRQGPGALSDLLLLGLVSKALARPGVVKYLTFGLQGNTRAHADALARVKAQITASGALEATAEEEPGGPRQFLGEKVEEIKENPPADTVISPGFDVPGVPFVQNTTPNLSVNPASSLASAFNTGTGTPDQTTMERGKALFPNSITFAAKGGIMNTKKAFQRVA